MPPGGAHPAGWNAEEPSPERLPARWAAAIFIAALAVRAILLVDLSLCDPLFALPVADEGTNLEDARRLVGVGFRIEEPYERPPLVPHLLALPILAGFAGDPSGTAPEPGLAWLVKGAQALLDSVTAVLIAAIALRLAGRRAAIWAGGVHAAGFLPAFACTQIVDTTAATFLAVLSLRLALGALEDRAAGSWLLAGATAGLAALARSPLLLALPALAFAPWSVPGARAERLRSAALLVGGAAAMILPAALANARLGGDRVLIASGTGLELWIGNRPGGGFGADGLSTLPAGARRAELLAETAHLERPSERSAHFAARTLRELAGHPLFAAGRLATKTHALLHSLDIPDVRNPREERERSWTLRLLPARSGIVIPLALVGIALASPLARRRALLVALLSAHGAAAIALVVSAHARAPLIALFAIPAGAALADLAARDTAPRGRALLAGSALILALLLAADPHGWRDRYREFVTDPVSLGTAFERTGDLEGARDAYERALRIDPGDPAAQTRLGSLDLAADDVAAAELRFRSAVAAAPSYAPGWSSLGTLLLFTGRGEEAAACFERAATADPHLAAPRGFLGQMHEDAGRLALAHPHYETARRLDPGTPLYGLLEARLLWKLHRPDDARALLAIVEKSAARALDAQETKLRKEILEDLELWPEGPPAPQAPPESVPGGD